MGRKQVWKRTLTLASSAAVLTAGLAGCTNKVEKITTCIAEQNYDEALDFYRAKVKDKDREELAEALRAIVLELPERFAADEIDYEQARRTLDTIEAMHLGTLSEDLLVVRAKIQALNTSKQAWLTAEQAYADGDWLTAAESYRRVDPLDPHYDDAVEKIEQSFAEYEAEVLAQVDELTAGDNYDAAISLLQEAIPNLEDAAALETRLEEVTAAAEEFRLAAARRAALEEAEAEASNGNLEAALGILERFQTESGDSNAELQAVHDQYVEDYVNQMLPQLLALMDRGDYVEALEMLEHARGVAEAESLTRCWPILRPWPVYLSDLRPDRDRFEEIKTGPDPKDTAGNSYRIASGNLFQLNATNGSGRRSPAWLNTSSMAATAGSVVLSRSAMRATASRQS